MKPMCYKCAEGDHMNCSGFVQVCYNEQVLFLVVCECICGGATVKLLKQRKEFELKKREQNANQGTAGRPSVPEVSSTS